MPCGDKKLDFIFQFFCPVKLKEKMANLGKTAITLTWAARTIIQENNNRLSTSASVVNADFLKHGFTNTAVSNSILSSTCSSAPTCFSNSKYRYRSFHCTLIP